MTYMVRARPRYRRAKPLSDWFDDITAKLGGSQESQCIAAGNAQVAELDAKTNDLARNWNPTGFYTPDEMSQVINANLDLIHKAQSAVDQSAAAPNALQESIIRATNDLGRAGQRSLDYIEAVKQAQQQGTLTINAPGFKRWVTDTMGAASSAIVTAATVACLEPWWAVALSAFQGAFDTVWSIAKAVGNVLVHVGEDIITVADNLDTIYTVVKYGALAFGVWWVWTNWGMLVGHADRHVRGALHV